MIGKQSENGKEKQGSWKIGVKTHQKDDQSEYTVVEIPKEIKSIIRLEKPYKEHCDFCEQQQLICWLVRYINNSWSAICATSYERLKDKALEYDWQI